MPPSYRRPSHQDLVDRGFRKVAEELLAPAVIPAPFSDDTDYGPRELRERFWSQGDSSWSVSRPRPYRAAPERLPTRPIKVSVVRGMGRSPMLSPARPLSLVLRRARLGYVTPPAFHAKQIGNLNALQIAVPHRAKLCIRRKQRREVIFALRSKRSINRRSPGGSGGYRRTQDSLWRC